MKKNYRIFWIVCASLFGIGIICLMIGFATGANIVNFKEQFRYGIVINENTFKDNYAEVATKQYMDIKELKIDVDAGEVELVLHDQPYIEVDARYNERWQKLTITQKEDKLQIRSNVRHGIGNIINNNANITVYIPRDMEFVQMKIDIGVGKLYAEDIQAREFILESGAGNAKIDNLAVGKFNLDAGVGEIEIENVRVEERGILDCNVGTISIKLQGSQEEYNYKLDLGVGNVKIGSDTYTGLGDDRRIQNGADKDITIDCGVGTVKITFEE